MITFRLPDEPTTVWNALALVTDTTPADWLLGPTPTWVEVVLVVANVVCDAPIMVLDKLKTFADWFLAANAAGMPREAMVATATETRTAERRRAELFINKKGKRIAAETAASHYKHIFTGFRSKFR